MLDLIEDQKVSNLTFEAFRLLGPALVSQRRMTTKNIKLGNAKIKKGHHLIVCLSAKNRSHMLHSDPMAFNEERMSEENPDKLGKMDFLPFSFGNRVCIG